MKPLLLLLCLPFFGYSQGRFGYMESPDPIALNQILLPGKHIGIEFMAENGRFFHRTEVRQPEFYYFLALPENKFYDLFVFPGDSVNIESQSDGKYIIKGRRSGEYQLLEQLRNNKLSILFQNEGLEYGLMNQFEKSYAISKETFEKRAKVISSFQNKVSPEYLYLLKTVNYLRRLGFLLQPYNPCSPQPNFAPASQKEEYFSEIDSLVKNLNKIDSSCIHALAFWLSPLMLNYSNYVVRSKTENKFDHKFDGAKIFEGRMKDVYLTTIMSDKVNNDYVDTKYLQLFYSLCQHEPFRKEIENMHNLEGRLSKDSILQNTFLLTEDKKNVTWKQMVEQNKGKVTYIDFWASWCAGCKLNVPKIESMKKRFPALTIVFISKDASVDKWQRSMDSWGIKDVGQQFHLDPQTKLAQIVAEPSIPRATLIDKEGKIVTIDADEPNSEKINGVIKALIEKQ